jgi:protocatechuate 3,4-dioxygenase beta subunit
MSGKHKVGELARGASAGFSRRWALTALTAGAALVASGRVATAACAITPGQTEGPFYPVAIRDYDWDLTRVAGGSGRAEGEVIEVTGQIQDAKCRPLSGCELEIWQANTHGLYNHPRDRPRGQPLDPNFQGYARLTTDKGGRYRFRTIVPGPYPARADWVRPPHIHFKVHAPLNPPVTTQMYFAGHALNANDLLLAPLSPAQRASLEVPFDKIRANGIRAGTFNLTLAG